jgi:hypothetical protein
MKNDVDKFIQGSAFRIKWQGCNFWEISHQSSEIHKTPALACSNDCFSMGSLDIYGN